MDSLWFMICVDVNKGRCDQVVMIWAVTKHKMGLNIFGQVIKVSDYSFTLFMICLG